MPDFCSIINVKLPERPEIERNERYKQMEESMKDYEKELEASFRTIKEGDVVKGTVIDVNEEEVTLDLKYYAQGIIKAEDMSADPSFSLLQDVKEGEELEAVVVSMDDGQGNILLSRKEANETLGWDVLQNDLEEKKDLSVKVTEAVNGGVVAYVEGIRGFIPASQLALSYVEDPSEYVGKKLTVRVITVDKEKEKLVLSAKEILREQEKEAHDHKVAMIVPGTVLEGTVESLQPYGAFVDLKDGLSGLVHISQICLYGIGFHSRRNRFPFLPLSGDQRRPLANLKIGLPRCCFPILLPVCLRRGFLSRCFHRGSRGLIPSAFPTARKQGRRQADCQ